MVWVSSCLCPPHLGPEEVQHRSSGHTHGGERRSPPPELRKTHWPQANDPSVELGGTDRVLHLQNHVIERHLAALSPSHGGYGSRATDSLRLSRSTHTSLYRESEFQSERLGLSGRNGGQITAPAPGIRNS